MNFACHHINNADTDGGVRVTRFGVGCDLKRLPSGDVVGDGELLDRSFIQFQECNEATRWTPPKALEVAAAVEFFLVNPIEFAVEQGLASIVGQSTFRTLFGERIHVEIVASNIGNSGLGWVDFSEFFLFIRLRQPTGRAGCVTHVDQVSIMEVKPPVTEGPRCSLGLCQFLRGIRTELLKFGESFRSRSFVDCRFHSGAVPRCGFSARRAPIKGLPVPILTFLPTECLPLATVIDLPTRAKNFVQRQSFGWPNFFQQGQRIRWRRLGNSEIGQRGSTFKEFIEEIP